MANQEFRIGQTVTFIGDLGTVVQLPRKIKKPELLTGEPTYRVRFGRDLSIAWVPADKLKPFTGEK